MNQNGKVGLLRAKIDSKLTRNEYINDLCHNARYFIRRWILCQSSSTFKNLVVNYHLVVSYPQQWHIRVNVSH